MMEACYLKLNVEVRRKRKLYMLEEVFLVDGRILLGGEEDDWFNKWLFKWLMREAC